MTKYSKENPAYAHLRMKWELESDEDIRSKAKTLTGMHLQSTIHGYTDRKIRYILHHRFNILRSNKVKSLLN